MNAVAPPQSAFRRFFASSYWNLVEVGTRGIWTAIKRDSASYLERRALYFKHFLLAQTFALHWRICIFEVALEIFLRLRAEAVN